MKAFLYNVDSSLFKPWSSGVRRGHSRETHIYMFILKKMFSRTSRPISFKLGTNHPWVKEILDYTNKGSGPLQRGDNHKNANISRGH
jgi:hypothetical protein